MDDRELRIEEKKLAVERRGQNLSAGKFLVGLVLLGLLGFGLDLKSFLYTQDKDDRTFLAAHRILLQEENLGKRLTHIAFLHEISGGRIEFLSQLEKQTQAELDEAKKNREKEQKVKERVAAETQKAGAEKIRQAKEAEKQAKKAAEEAKRRAEALRLDAQKSYDRALQEAYPGQDLFELKRRGALIP